jgi:Signal transduction histidine kinase regulating citrate/malate metabolism
MNEIPQLILDLLAIAEYVLFVIAILNMKIHITITKKRIFMVLVTFGIYLTAIFSGIDFLATFWLLQAVIISIFYFLFRTALRDLVKMWIISLLMVSMIEIIVRQMVVVFGVWNDRFTESVLCVIFTQCGLILYYVLIGRKVKNSLLQLSWKIWILMMGMMGIFLLMLSCFFFFSRDMAMQEYIRTRVLLTVFAGIATVILIILFEHYFQKTQEYKLYEQLAREYNEQQKEYFGQMLKKEQDTRKFRHDIVNHLLVVKNLFQKNEYGNAESYIAELLEDISSISAKQYDVGNEIINVIINYYFVPLSKEANVKVSGYIGETEHISQKDMCALVSNLVKNAAEAVKNIEDAKITFVVRRGERFACILLENSCREEAVFDKNGMLKTSKADSRDHGWGMKIVQEIVSKYHGEIRIFTEENRFKAEVYLPV